MPTYSYRCTECGNSFDIQQAFTDDTLTECPSCQGKLRKLFNSVGVTFNGSGFYRTDSRSTPSESSANSGSSSSSGGGSSQSGGSSAPAAASSGAQS